MLSRRVNTVRSRYVVYKMIKAMGARCQERPEMRTDGLPSQTAFVDSAPQSSLRPKAFGRCVLCCFTGCGLFTSTPRKGCVAV